MAEPNAFLDVCNAWKRTENEQSTFGYVKLRIGADQRVQVRFLDAAPVKRFLHYLNNKPIICPEHECLYCSRGDNAAPKFFINVVDRQDDRVKVLEFSLALRDQIIELVESLVTSPEKEAVSDPRQYDIVLSRTGKGQKDTRWGAAQLANVPFTSGNYQPYELDKFLTPMDPELMVQKQNERPVPVESSKPIVDFSEAPKAVVPSISDKVVNPLGDASVEL